MQKYRHNVEHTKKLGSATIIEQLQEVYADMSVEIEKMQEMQTDFSVGIILKTRLLAGSRVYAKYREAVIYSALWAL